ncbi:hypothetical protein GR183_12345 [Stappia sp. GBMRC 2046]|uniref:PepSY domain-containing protein n=1 Tax=Stappia sediminis TaxID=2692190 RepID=A0A7X3LV59_9HYPH|nr:hypothetical protein [Stappia sediminis]
MAVVSAGETAWAACLNQSQARQAVASGQARPLGAVSRSVGGEIVRADLCEQGGRLVYVLSVLSGGKVTKRVVDAKSGQALR